MRRKIKLAITGLNATKLVEKSFRIISMMTGNASFPTPTPSLADLTAATEALATASVPASGGDRHAILLRKDQEVVVANMLRTLGAYVTVEANGDGAVITSSGFELQRLPEPQSSISRPVDFVSERGKHSGGVELSWKSVLGAQSYVIDMTTGEPKDPLAVWTTVAITTKVKARFDNMEIGQFFYYRVKAIGRNSESPWSDISMVMAAA